MSVALAPTVEFLPVRCAHLRHSGPHRCNGRLLSVPPVLVATVTPLRSLAEASGAHAIQVCYACHRWNEIRLVARA